VEEVAEAVEAQSLLCEALAELYWRFASRGR